MKGERLYFVAETKSSLQPGDLRLIEAAKITRGRAHFAEIQVAESPAQCVVASNLDDLLSKAGS